MPFKLSRRLVDGLWLVGTLAIVFVAAHVAFTNLGHYLDGYDEGVYLESARLMDRGFPLYRSIFDSQAPLFLYLVDLGFRLFGESVRSGRLAEAGGFVLTVFSVALAGRELRTRLGGLLAGSIVLLSPMYLRFSRMVEADVPSAGFAALSVFCAARYASVGRRRWLVLAGLAVSASILVKLLGVYTYPALALLIFSRWAGKTSDWRVRLRNTALDVGLLLAIFVGVSGVFLVALGPAEVWDQAVTFHLVARTLDHSNWMLHHVGDLINYFHVEPLIVPGLPLIVFALFGGWRGLAVLAWAAFAWFGLINQQPLQDHNVPTLVPPLALAIGYGWGQLWSIMLRLARWTSSIAPRRAWIGAVGTAAFLVVALLALVRLEHHVAPAWSALRTIDAHGEEDAINLRVDPFVLAHSKPGDFILTDQQTIANWVDRDVPPGLADTSYVRMDTGYLTGPQIIAESTKYSVTVVVFASGRITRFPDVVQWVNENFPHHQDTGNGRVVYWK